MADPTNRKRLNFDPTINAGHILTFTSMVVAVMVSYSLLDKRVGVLEERSNTAIIQAADKQAEQKESLRVNVTPTAETPTATHTAVFNINGTNYKFLCLAA